MVVVVVVMIWVFRFDLCISILSISTFYNCTFIYKYLCNH